MSKIFCVWEKQQTTSLVRIWLVKCMNAFTFGHLPLECPYCHKHTKETIAKKKNKSGS